MNLVDAMSVSIETGRSDPAEIDDVLVASEHDDLEGESNERRNDAVHQVRVEDRKAKKAVHGEVRDLQGVLEGVSRR